MSAPIPSAQTISISAHQLQALVNALICTPDQVGELCEKNAYDIFVQDVVETVAAYYPSRLIDHALSEVLADTDPETNIFFDESVFEGMVNAVCNNCGGQPSEYFHAEHQWPTTKIEANDSIADPNDILSSGACAFASQVTDKTPKAQQEGMEPSP